MNTPTPSPTPRTTKRREELRGKTIAAQFALLEAHAQELERELAAAQDEADRRTREVELCLVEQIKMNAENDRLRGIIARNAMQRLDGTKFYITPADISDSIEIAAHYRERHANTQTQTGGATPPHIVRT